MKTGDDEMFDSENMAELDQLVAEEIINGLSMYPACLVYCNPSDDKKKVVQPTNDGNLLSDSNGYIWIAQE